jgi:hypothetical protein
VRNFASEQPEGATAEESAAPDSVPVPPAGQAKRPAPDKGRRKGTESGLPGLVFAITLAAFWVGCGSAYVAGYVGPDRLGDLAIQQIAVFAAAIVIPPMLFVALAWALARGQAMGRASRDLAEKIQMLVTADDGSARSAARLGRAVRHELDALNAGIDGAHQRLLALENILQCQIAALDEAGARAEIRGHSVAAKLSEECDRLDGLGRALGDAAAQAGQTLNAHTSGLAGSIETAQMALDEKLAALSASLDAAAARAGVSLQSHAGALAGTIEGAQTALAGKVAKARDGLTVHISSLEAALEGAVERAAENLAARAAHLQALMQTAETALHGAGQSLETQAQDFRKSAETVASAPRNAAIELDRQAKAIEAAADATMARAEFVLGRHERHRARMGELLQELRDEGAAFEKALGAQRAALEKAISLLGPETQKFETLAADTGRHVELIMDNAAARASQIVEALAAEAERLDGIGAASGDTLQRLTASLHEAGRSADALFGDAAEEARTRAAALVGEAVAECERLIAASADLSAQSQGLRTALGDVAGDVERHLATLPGIARQEAQRVREAMQAEIEALLDMSARTIATMHARNAGASDASRSEESPEGHAAGQGGDSDGLLARARRLTQRPRRSRPSQARPAGGNEAKNWDMSVLLAAVETGETQDRELRPSSAAALGALEAALADMALDLSAFDSGPAPGEEEWRRYLAGDRAVFARRLAEAIDSDAVTRITNLHRENAKFRETADAYIAEFETLLDHARQGDGAGLLVSTMLGSDTGKIYLALAYALGRLS